MPFDQTSPEFLGQLRNIARGLIQWAGQEGQEGAHQGQQDASPPGMTLPSPGPQPQLRAGQDLNQPPPQTQGMPGQRNASGMLLLAPDGRALFVRRAANARDHAGQWSIPAGMTEGDESPWQGALRETREEVGDCFGDCGDQRPQLLDHRVGDDGTGFTTFGGRVQDAFTPMLTDEHDGYQWANLDAPPQPLHPGLQATLDFAMDPLTEKGSKIMSSMKSQYGPEKGERVFYASKNAGKISGVDNIGHTQPTFPAPGQGQRSNTAFSANLDAGGGAGGWGHQGQRPPQPSPGTWDSPRWGNQPSPTRAVPTPLRQTTDADLAKRFRLLDTHTGQTHDLNVAGRDVGTPQGARTKYFGVGANTSRDVGTAAGARKAAETRRRGGGAQQQPPRAAPGTPSSGQFQQRTPTPAQVGRAAGRQIEAAYPWGYRSSHSSEYENGEDQTGKTAEIEAAVRRQGNVRDPQAVAAATRAKMIGRPALQRKAAAARSSDQTLTGPGSGAPPPPVGEDDAWESPAWDAGGGAGGWGHGGLTPPQHDAFQTPQSDPMTRPADQGAPQQGMGMRRPLSGGMRGAGMAGSGMAMGGGPKYTHSIKMDYGGGTVDERKFTRPMPSVTPPMQAEQMDAGAAWGSPQWGQQDQSSAVPMARTVGPAPKGGRAATRF